MTLTLLALSLSAAALPLTVDPVAPEQAPSSHGLVRPLPLPCLPPPDLDALWDLDELLDGTGMIEPGAPSPAQLAEAMDDFSRELVVCVGDSQGVVGDLEVELTVACTGQVREARIVDPGGLDPDLVACVEELLSYAPFPAHGLPEGYRFGYSLRIWYP